MQRIRTRSMVRLAVLSGVLLAWPAASWSADPADMGGTHQGPGNAGATDDGSTYRGTGAQGVSGRDTAEQAASDKSHKSATNFVKDAAAGGMAEVKLGQLAEQKATSPSVKAYGQRMADDHGKVNDELKTRAAEKNVQLPKSLDSKHQALYDRLSKLSGHQFDQTYMDEMVKDHKADIAEFQKAANSSDPQVKDFASKTLPTLEDHLREAQQVASATENINKPNR